MRAANSSARPLEHVAEAKTSPASTSRSPVRQSSSARFRRTDAEARRLSAARLATPKILLYSHDTFGLGNIRRTLLLAEELSEQYTGAAILMVTGSQMVHSFRIPDGVDYIKLPCLDRVDAERYEPRFLRSWSEEVKRTRSAILEKSVLGFEPDLMIVDKRPAGVDGELAATLEEIRRKRLPTKLVLGVRDILDEPERTRRTLQTNGSFETIERFYDEVWVYGSQSIFDTVREYGFPDAVARITRFCGYLKRPTAPRVRESGPPHVLVTTGGGGDGAEMIEAYLEGLATLPRNVALRTTVVFGPQMSDASRASVRERFGYLADVTFSDFEPDLTPLYSESDIVVSMAGYNTVCELLSFGHHAILVPRAEPVQEQLIRARLLAAQGLFDIVEPEDLKPTTLISKVLAALKPVEVARTPFDLDGLPRIRERMRALLAAEEEEA
ncbi:MAG TPA: glycosyltransferase [Pyrinomonadaceae bacterium]|jgi:predicted glycosyltransferase|nr:glycosyltransferase [Pyrinomonadaceae bacterium]